MAKRKGQLALEWIIISTILVIGLIAGASAVRDSITLETVQVGQAAGTLNQNYQASSVTFTGRGGVPYTISGCSYNGNTPTSISMQ